jgi:hypothetical protein
MNVRRNLWFPLLALVAMGVSGCDSGSSGGSCGDGVVQTVEECDDGPANSDTAADACRTDCIAPGCGDAVVDSAEGCDDGADNSNVAIDACRTDCTPAGCGDNVVDTGEGCDPPAGAGCDDDCQVIPICGNGTVEGTEGCDDGAGNSNMLADACRTDCVPHSCGDNVVDTAEQCDPPDGGVTCDASCFYSYDCGDGSVDGIEECDCGTDPGDLPMGCTGINSDMLPDACRTNCMVASCGDGVLDVGEGCEPPDGTTCDQFCIRILQPIGGPCAADLDCQSNFCGDEPGFANPQGSCIDFCDINPCAAGARCTTISLSPLLQLCYPGCTQQSDCRPGYSCFDGLSTAGAVCSPDCTANSQCAGGACNVYTGYCGTDLGLLRDGAACTLDGDCESGNCIEEGTPGISPSFPGGYCSSLCNTSANTCPTGETCSSIFAPVAHQLGLCLADCTASTECRQAEGYTCQANPFPPVAGTVCAP